MRARQVLTLEAVTNSWISVRSLIRAKSIRACNMSRNGLRSIGLRSFGANSRVTKSIQTKLGSLSTRQVVGMPNNAPRLKRGIMQ